MNRIIIITLIVYIAVGLLLWVMKPSLMFQSNGSIKSFGVNEDETIFFFPIVLIFIAIIIYIIFLRILSN
jgi:hypothetical protein